MAPSEGQGARVAVPSHARTVGHAHRVLHRALQRAVENETLSRNVASVTRPPKVETHEVETLNAEQMASVLSKMIEPSALSHRHSCTDNGHAAW